MPLALPPPSAGKEKGPQQSALDALWAALQSAGKDGPAPEILAKTLQTILVLWQVTSRELLGSFTSSCIA